ncbi:hypothetical protein MJO28_015625 [Puccinia striiformis f. sp. tritici]|uniref:Uncharacterized protein n=1 Tax=Puccinia striiformis f. sp. tritici TaxID=168172 RepID=A0ACC0DR69_9BASI|nr:hypothetical protein MJO28_015625 [Puccinia striiformis f. sp. tritici]
MADPSDYRQQGDLAVLGFAKIWKRDDAEDSTNMCQRLLRCSLETHMIQSKPTILPLLRQQVIKITSLPGQGDLPEEAAYKLKLIVEAQSETKDTLQQIRDSVQALRIHSRAEADQETCPGPEDDRNYEEMKRFRLERVYALQMRLLHDLDRLFSHTSRTIEIRGLSNHLTSDLRPPKLLDGLINKISEDVDSIVRWLAEPEFDAVQDDWHTHIACLNNDLKTLYMRPTKTNSDVQTPNQRLRVTQLTQLALPVARLSIMFLNKLSKQAGMNKKRLPLYTKMRSKQLETLSLLSQDVSRSVQAIVLTTASGRTTNLPFELKELGDCLGSALVLVKEHFLPLIPDTDGFTNQTYFSTWFDNWSTTFKLAVRNLKNACRET